MIDASTRTANLMASLLPNTFARYATCMTMDQTRKFIIVHSATCVGLGLGLELTIGIVCGATPVCHSPMMSIDAFHKNYKAVAQSVLMICFNRRSHYVV
jgi:hypothetical protein